MKESVGKNGDKKTKPLKAKDKDSHLIELILEKKDMDAFEKLMEKYQDRVWRLARGITRSDSDAEDVLQDVFLTVFRKLKSFEGRSSFSSWLYRIAANASYMKIRSRKGTQAYAPEDIAPLVDKDEADAKSEWANDPEEVLGSKEAVGVITEAIDMLPREYRAVLVLRDIEGFDNKEVADMLGLTVPAIKSRLHRGRIFLRKKLNDFFESEVKNQQTA